jgi:hypothetical protein
MHAKTNDASMEHMLKNATLIIFVFDEEKSREAPVGVLRRERRLFWSCEAAAKSAAIHWILASSLRSSQE